MPTDPLDRDAPDRPRRSGTIVSATLLSVLTLALGVRVVTWLFPPNRTLTVDRPAHGTLVGHGINCGTLESDCSVSLPAAERVGLEAQPDAGYLLAAYTGDCERGGRTVMTVSRRCGARFDPDPTIRAPTISHD